ncbi:peptide ABC transporter ATP-binding protein [Tumebacillus algifaecis]|uniref:Peptide ABC transporter ATP-binding protein n=1 Tax=Tumebacillus algifaecis TaxID=1214604 RepID=A0A223D6R0_9BACL|nr:ABC transporter ATP-binding protein [Tumebacillus algifaecis]ASS77096.1 peptide ABC transporter ATP-binding protein [Tumebacillus algifaecis]
MNNLLEITGLKTHFIGEGRVNPAVDGVDFAVRKGETLGIVGESGCGKSATSLSVMRLLPKTGALIAGGEIRYKGNNLLELSEASMRKVRGNEIAMIFQEPMTSLNPVYTIGQQLSESVMLHLGYSKQKAREHSVSMLKKVNIPRAEKILDEYPHQLSGGMRQRVMIAMAMSCEPELLIADEPTTALDVTIQAQILDLMRELKEKQGTSIMLITHDLGVVAEMCDRVVVMYAGQVVEEADVYTLFDAPAHPYTQGLMRSIPKIDQDQERLDSIPGNVPLPGSVTSGCRFASRCPYVEARCLAEMPPLIKLDHGQQCRCWLHAGNADKEVSA